MRGRMSDAPSCAAPVAVGSVIGQIARLKGCRVVGVAGDAAKCDFVVEEYGFAACIDRRSANLREQLKRNVHL